MAISARLRGYPSAIVATGSLSEYGAGCDCPGEADRPLFAVVTFTCRVVLLLCANAQGSARGLKNIVGQPQATRNAPTGQSWTVEDALELYNVPAWSSGYFSINVAGHVVVRPDTTAEHEIDLLEVVQGLQERDLSAPVVIRFSDILAHRLRHLHAAFSRAIAENDYRNRYTAVYPIKVNQQRLVVEEVFRYGKEFGFGL